MNPYQEAVQEFHEDTASTVGLTPTMRDRQLRARLIMEEAVETIAAMGFDAHATFHDNVIGTRSHSNKTADLSLPAAIDGLCDLLYVTFGTAVAWGIDLDPFFREVHRANMTKLTGPKRADGKQLKPEGWQPPRIAAILTRQVRKTEAWDALAKAQIPTFESITPPRVDEITGDPMLTEANATPEPIHGC